MPLKPKPPNGLREWLYRANLWPLWGPRTAERIMAEIESIPAALEKVNTHHQHDTATQVQCLYLKLRRNVGVILKHASKIILATLLLAGGCRRDRIAIETHRRPTWPEGGCYGRWHDGNASVGIVWDLFNKSEQVKTQQNR